MKKLQIIAAVMLTLPPAAVFADKPIPPSALPQAVQTMITSYFPGKTIQYAEGDKNSFEISLNDGTQIDININGEWEEIRSYSGVPAALLPAAAAEYTAALFPNIPVIKAEQDWETIEITLGNQAEIEFTLDGQWSQIKSPAGVPLSELPAAVSDYLNAEYPNITVLRAEKEWKQMRILLANRMLLFFDDKGSLTGQKQAH